MSEIDAKVLQRLREIVGPAGWLDDPDALEPYLTEWRGLYRGRTPLLVLPGTVDEVAAVLATCNEAGIGVVPQGGNTGLCGGAIPDLDGRQILLALGRLDRIREIDPANNTITVEAGCVLADIQRAADEVDRLFPLSLAAEGSCQIGGSLSTDAGGTNVLRYGTAREQVLGLEVVLPDGRVWSGLRRLLKDTAGYDLKHLFIGAEGTLGVITAAVLKLYPRPRGVATAFVGLDGLDATLDLLHDSGEGLTALEVLPRIGLEFVLKHIPDTRDPFDRPYEWYALLEWVSSESDLAANEALGGIVSRGLESGAIRDGVLAVSEAQRASLWRLRDSMSAAQKPEGGSIKHDIAVPVSSLPAFIRDATAAVEKELPGVRVVAFGHIGDGNVHFNLSQPVGYDQAAFLSDWGRFNRIVHDIAVSFGGTFSAEHGIGQLKVSELERCRSEVELSLMRAVKVQLDPRNIMNPGKVIRVRA